MPGCAWVMTRLSNPSIGKIAKMSAKVRLMGQLRFEVGVVFITPYYNLYVYGYSSHYGLNCLYKERGGAFGAVITDEERLFVGAEGAVNE